MKLFTVFIASMFVTGTYAFDGAKYFKKNCKSCHSIGGGDVVGPDLAGLSKRRKVDWIVKFVNYPDGMINGDEEEAGYEKPDALAKKVYELYKPTVMTEIEMSKAQVKGLLKYIDSLGKKPKGKITTLK
jgi:cytochrome c2